MKKLCRVLAFLFLLCLLCSCRAEPPVRFSALFLDVGQGNAALLRTPQGDILVDCGPEASQESLCRKLKANGVKTLQCLILTHPDEDHIGGADVILEQFAVKHLLYNGATEKSESFSRLLESAKKKKIEPVAVRAGDASRLGELQISFYYPVSDPASGNQGSLIFRAQYQSQSVLFMGDAEEAAEKQLLSNLTADQLSATVLLAGHHGSATSCSPEFLHAVNPQIAVISCGAGNRYGHPDGRVLARLQNLGTTVYRTDLNGDLLFQWNGETLSVKTEKEGK